MIDQQTTSARICILESVLAHTQIIIFITFDSLRLQYLMTHTHHDQETKRSVCMKEKENSTNKAIVHVAACVDGNRARRGFSLFALSVLILQLHGGLSSLRAWTCGLEAGGPGRRCEELLAKRVRTGWT